MRIIVIGAGLIGVSTAYFLRDSGHEVTVIDRNEGPALGASFANGGMLTPSQAGPWNTPGIGLKLLKWLGREDSPLVISPAALMSVMGWGISFLKNSSGPLYSQNLRKNAALATYSLKMLQELQKESAIKYDRASRGTLKLFRTTDLLNEARRVMELANVEHVAFEMLDKHSIVELEPSLVSVKNEIAGGIYYPEDESGDAYKFCQALAGLAAGRGVRFQYGTSIDRFIKRQGIITGIETSSELMEADYYVLAAGSYSPGLAGGLGLDIPIRPVKGYSITFRHSPDKGPVIPVIDESRHLAVTPFPDRIRISGAAELRGHDVTINNNRISMMVGFFRELFPGIARSVDYSTGMPWAGLRPYSCDGTPILGPCAIDNLILNTGHGHLGWTMAAGSGKLIADLLCTGKTDLDLAPYSLSRFGP